MREVADTITLKFGVRDDWLSGMDAVLEVMEKAKEKHPSTEIHVEVQFY